MLQKPKFTAVLLCVVLLVWQEFEPVLRAQGTGFTPQQLDQLLSPIALFPDSLLSQIMTASTTPQQILDVDNWVNANPGLQGTALTDAAQQQGFDPAFIALVNFPQVLDMMAENIDDYAAIGEAFSADQGAVTDSIQRLRAKAYASGALSTNQQQTVVVQQGPQTIYVIQPTNPQVVFVPQYDPTMVFGPPAPGAMVGPALLTFGVGIGIGALIASSQPWGWGGWGWNWGSRRAYFNHAYWGGWARPYRPPVMWFQPRPVVWANRPGFGGNWGYRPPNWVPPRPGPRPPGRPPWSAANRPGSRPPTNRPPVNRPPTNRPPANRPPANRPSTNRPSTNRPSTNRPPANNPSTNRPSTNRPSTNRPPANNPSTNRPSTNRPPPSRQPANRPPGNQTGRPPSTGGSNPRQRQTPSEPNQRPNRPTSQPNPNPQTASRRHVSTGSLN
jgi:hypothetical protein